MKIRGTLNFRTLLFIVCALIFFSSLINFAILAMISSSVGGNALNGKIENGKYYVGNHGTYTEVSKNVFMRMN